MKIVRRACSVPTIGRVTALVLICLLSFHTAVHATKILTIGSSVTFGAASMSGGYQNLLQQLLAWHGELDTFVGQNINGSMFMQFPYNSGFSAYSVGPRDVNGYGMLSGAVTQAAMALGPDIVCWLACTDGSGTLQQKQQDLMDWCTSVDAAKPGVRILLANYADSSASNKNTYEPMLMSVASSQKALGHNVEYVPGMGQSNVNRGSDNMHPDGDWYDRLGAVWYRGITGQAIPSYAPFVQNLSATLVPPARVNLTWNKGTTINYPNGASTTTAFKVDRTSNPGDWSAWTTVADLGATATAYADDITAIAPGTLLCYRVRAFCGTAPSSIRSISTMVIPPRGTPVTVTNPSFEIPYVLDPCDSTCILGRDYTHGVGWTLSRSASGTAKVVRWGCTESSLLRMDQEQWLNLTGAGASVSQSIAGLTVGKTYTIQFSAMQAGIDIYGQAQGTKRQTIRLNFGTDSVGLAEPPVDESLKSFAFAVTAKATTEVLRLTGTNAHGGDNTAYIDAVFIAEGAPTTAAQRLPQSMLISAPSRGAMALYDIRGRMLSMTNGSCAALRTAASGIVIESAGGPVSSRKAVVNKMTD